LAPASLAKSSTAPQIPELSIGRSAACASPRAPASLAKYPLVSCGRPQADPPPLKIEGKIGGSTTLGFTTLASLITLFTGSLRFMDIYLPLLTA